MSYSQPPAGPSGSKRRRQEEPDQASLIQTNFYMPPALAIKTASSGFHKYDSQGGISRQRAQMDFERASAQLRAERQFRAIMDEENKRIRMAGGVAWPTLREREEVGETSANAAFNGPGRETRAESEILPASDVKVENTAPAAPVQPPNINSDSPHHAHLASLYDAEELLPEAQRTIVIHPGSRYLRIGRATDSLPVTVRNCIYRKIKSEGGKKVPNGFGRREIYASKFVEESSKRATDRVAEGIITSEVIAPELPINAEAGPSNSTPPPTMIAPSEDLVATLASAPEPPANAEEPPTPGTIATTVTELPPQSAIPVEAISEEEQERQDGLTEVIGDARKALRERMRYNKLRLPPGKAEVPVNMVTRFNANSVPVELPTLSDPHGVEWLEDYSADKLFPAADLHVPEEAPYELRYPLSGRTFNTDEYDPAFPEVLLSDIQDIVEHSLGQLQPPVDARRLKNYSVVLIVPDWIEKGYIETMSTMLLQTLGFKQLGILQESVCATFGAGLSSACIVDIGATRTAVTCVDDGLVLQESRQVLDFGGDEVTAFYVDLLKRSSFPYKEVDLASRLDREMMDDLKIRTCTLMDSYVTNNVHKFYVKRKDALTKEYTFQTYDQPVISSSCIFDPRAMDWRKKDRVRRLPLRNVAFDEDGLGGLEDDPPSAAMQNSVRRAVMAEMAVPVDAPPPIDPANPAPSDVTPGTTPADQDPTQQPQAPPYVPPPPQIPIMSNEEILRDSNRLTLEYAITESLFAVESKSLSLASAILVLGGTSLIEGLAPALQWRIDYMIERKTGLQANCAILPPPRGMDPRTVTWRGGAVYSRLDSMGEAWIRRGEWGDLRMRAYRVRLG